MKFFAQLQNVQPEQCFPFSVLHGATKAGLAFLTMVSFQDHQILMFCHDPWHLIQVH